MSNTRHLLENNYLCHLTPEQGWFQQVASKFHKPVLTPSLILVIALFNITLLYDFFFKFLLDFVKQKFKTTS